MRSSIRSIAPTETGGSRSGTAATWDGLSAPAADSPAIPILRCRSGTGLAQPRVPASALPRRPKSRRPRLRQQLPRLFCSVIRSDERALEVLLRRSTESFVSARLHLNERCMDAGSGRPDVFPPPPVRVLTSAHPGFDAPTKKAVSLDPSEGPGAQRLRQLRQRHGAVSLPVRRLWHPRRAAAQQCAQLRRRIDGGHALADRPHLLHASLEYRPPLGYLDAQAAEAQSADAAHRSRSAVLDQRAISFLPRRKGQLRFAGHRRRLRPLSASSITPTRGAPAKTSSPPPLRSRTPRPLKASKEASPSRALALGILPRGRSLCPNRFSRRRAAARTVFARVTIQSPPSVHGFSASMSSSTRLTEPPASLG